MLAGRHLLLLQTRKGGVCCVQCGYSQTQADNIDFWCGWRERGGAGCNSQLSPLPGGPGGCEVRCLVGCLVGRWVGWLAVVVPPCLAATQMAAARDNK